ncbi:MAG: hypothetical protein AB7F09_10955 [Parvibaculaceae bacterium]
MPEKLNLSRGWLLEDIRAAVASFDELKLSEHSVPSKADLEESLKSTETALKSAHNSLK